MKNKVQPNWCVKCDLWRPPSWFVHTCFGYGVLAKCKFKPGKETLHCDTCSHHIPRKDEPLGLGLKKWWFLSENHKFWLAGVQHDLEYEMLKPGDSTKATDKNFFCNCWAFVENTWDKIEAYTFWGFTKLRGALR